MFNLHEKKVTRFKFPMKYFWFSGNFILAHRLRFVQLIKELRRNELDASAIRFIDRATFYLIPFSSL